MLKSSPVFANKSTTTDDDARLDIRANGLWESRFSKTFFDVKIFNPHAKTCPKDISEAYKMHEQMKKLKYEQRIREVEKASFNPLVFSCTGGAGPSASKVIKRIAGKLRTHTLTSLLISGQKSASRFCEAPFFASVAHDRCVVVESLKPQ